MSKKFFFNSETPPLEDGPEDNIDLLNDETFGSGAVDEDWENEHNNYAEMHSQDLQLDMGLGHRGSGIDEDELELSNLQLAAAVEELVLNSDQDQDAIDPAIVSLRKESRPGSYDPRLTEKLLSPYLGERESFSRDSSTYSSQASPSLFQSEGLKNIWSTSDTTPQDSFSIQSPSLILERQMLNEKLRKMFINKEDSPPLEDAAIVSAVKTSSNSWSMASQGNLLQQHMLLKPDMVRAEDLEKQLSTSQGPIRGPSPTFGISIPKEESSGQDSSDRSLPARSVSPVFGSPSSNTMPIGTPPKHIAEMIQQQAMHNRPPMPHPFPANIPPHPMGPSRGFYNMPPGVRIPPPGMVIPPRPWGPQNPLNRPSVNPLIPQDLMKRLGMHGNFPLSMIPGSPPSNMSPIGSPRFVQAPRRAPHPNVGFGRPLLPHGPNHGPIHHGFRIPPPGFPNHRFARPYQSYQGPGHLHPEHSRFVRMRRQMSNRNHYGHQQNQRGQGRENGSDHRQSYLMSNREKEWVIKIQMMALQSDRPEIDDYYYKHYIDKRLREGGLSSDDDNSEQKRLITPTKTNLDNKKYVPVQFNNSLGKLTISSVYNPRQIIDVVPAEKEEENLNESTVDYKTSMNKRLEIYKVIETAYTHVMAIEEKWLQLEMQELPEEKRTAAEQKIKDDAEVLEDVLFNSSATKEGIEAVSQILKIRKGKRLMCRALMLISKNRSFDVIILMVKQLPVLIKRDQREEILPEFYIPVSKVIENFDSNCLAQVSAALAPTVSALCKDKFGLSLTCKVLSVGQSHLDLSEEATDNGKMWSNFVNCAMKTLLSLYEKSNQNPPALLDETLCSDVIALFKKHNELATADVKLTSSNLKCIERVLSPKIDRSADSELLGAEPLSPEA